MTDYVEHIHMALEAAEGVDPCEKCEQRQGCWNARDKVIEAAMQGESEEDPFLAADAYTDSLNDELCADGKDSLIRMLMAAMYIMDHPPLVVPHFD